MEGVLPLFEPQIVHESLVVGFDAPHFSPHAAEDGNLVFLVLPGALEAEEDGSVGIVDVEVPMVGDGVLRQIGRGLFHDLPPFRRLRGRHKQVVRSVFLPERSACLSRR